MQDFIEVVFGDEPFERFIEVLLAEGDGGHCFGASELFVVQSSSLKMSCWARCASILRRNLAMSHRRTMIAISPPTTRGSVSMLKNLKALALLDWKFTRSP